MRINLTHGGLSVALTAFFLVSSGPASAIEAASIATRSFGQASANGLVLSGMVAVLLAFIAVAFAHWRALARAIGYRPLPTRRRFGVR